MAAAASFADEDVWSTAAQAETASAQDRANRPVRIAGGKSILR